MSAASDDEAMVLGRYEDILRRARRLVIGDRALHDPEDLVQDTFLRWWATRQGRGVTLATPAHAYQFLAAVLGNRAVDANRRAALRRTLSLDAVPEGVEPQWAVAPGSTEDEALDLALLDEVVAASEGNPGALPLFLLALGFTYPEIGALLGEDPAKTKSAGHRWRVGWRAAHGRYEGAA